MATLQLPDPAEAGGAEPDHLLLLAHGEPMVRRQARFCILTFQHYALRRPGRYQVTVYTDRPATFTGLGGNVNVVPLTRAQLRRWQGPRRYVHRVKAEVLRHFSRDRRGRIAFVDSDAYFVQDPAELFARIGPGRGVLHLDEGRLCDRRDEIAAELHDFVRATDVTFPDGRVARIPEETRMWNSGVVGLAAADLDLLEVSLALLDALYDRHQRHNIEQLALSHTLATRLQLLPCDDVVYHYWGRKFGVDRQVRQFLARHRDAPIQRKAAAAASLAPTADWDRPRLHRRIARRLRRLMI